MIDIRAGRQADAERISAIVCRCYEGFGETGGWSSRVVAEVKQLRGAVECIRDLIRDESVFVAEARATILGIVSVKDNEITKLFVDPDHQRRGIGGRLFAHAESVVRNCGFSTLFLGAAVETPIPFYEKMGMRVVRRRTIDRGPCQGMASTILEKALL